MYVNQFFNIYRINARAVLKPSKPEAAALALAKIVEVNLGQN
jgi:hypothetical protein